MEEGLATTAAGDWGPFAEVGWSGSASANTTMHYFDLASEDHIIQETFAYLLLS